MWLSSLLKIRSKFHSLEKFLYQNKNNSNNKQFREHSLLHKAISRIKIFKEKEARQRTLINRKLMEMETKYATKNVTHMKSKSEQTPRDLILLKTKTPSKNSEDENIKDDFRLQKQHWSRNRKIIPSHLSDFVSLHFGDSFCRTVTEG